ncbi:3-methyl-2-oxobutanoate hydroxymethyltransferase [Roseateles sp. BYS96W]|uniref:3-methyl-2-oxobutanoate hydroxymethyltransferase n=1 Tax=Pelomonas nitida TaxID=3299027 RepID=A0ABW7GAK8_9BURK
MTDRKPMTLPRLAQMHASGEKIAMLTCYDAAFASLLDEAGVDMLLIGDSLGNVLQGRGSTAPVSLDDMLYHTTCVRRGVKYAFVVADLPFDSYHVSKEEAWKSAAALVKAGAHMVKLEGGGWTAETVRFLSERGIPVCVHLGFTPQTVTALGGFKVQGRDEESAARMKRESQQAVQAGAAMLLYEMVPAALAAEITAASPVPVIGIGAGVGCSGQVLVLHDMLNITPGRKPRFVKDFMAGKDSVLAGVKGYVDEVKAGAFPVNAVHGF